MREYKFRGKSTTSIERLDEIGFKHDNGWVHGTYIDGYIINGVEEASTDYIAIGNWCPVIPETVGLDTGLKDRNGKDIHVGDILEDDIGKVQIVFSDDDEIHCDTWVTFSDLSGYLKNNYGVVIGNTIDNPGLLEAE